MKRCRNLFLVLLALCLTLPLWAASVEEARTPANPLDQGGDNCSSATVITSIPYCDTGTTAGFLNDFPVPCADASIARDVVYRYTPSVTTVLSFSLCGTSYNSALTVWRGCPTQNVLICCSDNLCGDDACCSGVTLIPGSDYYIVVDGGVGANNFGDYLFNVVAGQSCPNTPCAQDTCPFPSRDVEPVNNSCAAGIGNITCGEILCGEITTSADRDWYRFNFTQFPCADVRINVFGNDTPGRFPFGQGLNPKVSIWSFDCTTMLAQDDDGGIGLDALLDSLCLPAGSYSILVESSGGTGPYEIGIACTFCECPACPYPNNDVEPNNICTSGGGVVTCEDTLCGFVEPGNSGDYYYLDIMGPGCQYISIDVFGNDTPGYFPFGQGLNPTVTLYSINCIDVLGVDFNSGIGEDARIDSVCLEPGLYRLFISGSPANQNSGPYIIATSCTPCPCPDTCNYENRDNEALNGTCGTFNPPMICGDTLCGDITAVNDVDWYLLTAVGPGLIRVTIDVFADDTPGWYPFGQGLDPMVRLVGAGCTNVIAVDTAGGVGEDARIEFCVPQGSYNIQVQQEDFTTGPYILATHCEPCDTCPYPNLDIEPINNQCGTFNSILTCSDIVCGDIEPAFDVDWYVFRTPVGGGCVNAFIDVFGDDSPGWYPFGRGLNPMIQIWTIDCATLLWQDLNSGIGEDASLTTPCLEPGQLYAVRVSSDSLDPATNGPYILSIACEPCDCGPPCTLVCPENALLENEPCPSFVDTTNGGCDSNPRDFLRLLCNQTYCGTAYSDPSYTDQDWYRLLVVAPSQVRLCVNSEFNGYLSIYQRGPGLDPCPGSDLIDCRYIAGCQGLQCVSLCLTSGTYLVEFSPTGLEPVNCWDYILSAACSPCEPEICPAPDSLVIHYPDSMGVSDSLENVALYWSAVPGATEYRIYRTSSNNGGIVVQPANYVASTNNTFYLHEGVVLNNGVTEIWIYEVVAYCEYNTEPCDDLPAAATPQEPRLLRPRE